MTFHSGEVCDAAIVQLNENENLRLRQPHRSGDFWNFKPGSRLEIIDLHMVHVTLQVLNSAVYLRKTVLNHMDQPAEEQGGRRVFRH